MLFSCANNSNNTSSSNINSSVNNSSGNSQSSSPSNNTSSTNSSSSNQSNSSTSTSSSDSTNSSSSSSSTLPPISYVQVFALVSYTHIYAWNDEGEILDTWPGNGMKSYDSEWNYYDFVGYTSLNVIFNIGSNQDQTADLFAPSAGYYWYYDGSLHTEKPGETNPDNEYVDASSWKEEKEYPWANTPEITLKEIWHLYVVIPLLLLIH